MKIYVPSISINGLNKGPDYEAIFASGFSAGYEDGYNEYPCLEYTPLTFDIISGGTIYWKAGDPEYVEPLTIMYKKNDEEWISITSTTGGTPIDVKAGDTLKFRGNNVLYLGNSFDSDNDCRYSLRGNIMSLIDAFSYPTLTSVPPRAFYGLFQHIPFKPGTQGLCDASNLLLPATTLAESCYKNMFYYCEGLTTAPVLPATTLAESCYEGMFRKCKSLTTAPVLPATTLANNCYYDMFEFCTSLTKAPTILPATTLVDGCYSNMFGSCTSLTSAPVLPATTLAEGCYMGMFARCTRLLKAPVLPATTLAKFCYGYMFEFCTGLNYIKCLATDFPAGCTNGWVRDVTLYGTFVKDPNATWSRGISGIPNNWRIISE